MCGRAGAEGYAAQGCTPFAATPDKGVDVLGVEEPPPEPPQALKNNAADTATLNASFFIVYPRYPMQKPLHLAIPGIISGIGREPEKY